MPDDRDVGASERTQSDLAGEPLTASVRDILDEHADAARRADDDREAEEADRERAARRKLDEQQTALRHSGGQRRLRPRRSVDRWDRGGERAEGSGNLGIDPRLLAGGALLGVILAGGVRRLLLLGAVAAAGWLLYRRVLEPAGDPGTALQ